MKKFLDEYWKRFRKKIKTITWPIPHASVIAFIFIILGLSLFIVNKLLLVQLYFFQIKDMPLAVKAPADIPLLSQNYVPDITAQAAYVMDDDSKMVVYSRREELRFSPASTTKIMTALVGLAHYRLQDILTIQRANVTPVVVGFPKGTGVTFENLLYSMFLPSGNDAAYAVGDNYPGGMDGFVAAMNRKAKELHLVSTHYGDPVGLYDEQDYTTVRDLARLASIAIKNPEIAKIVRTKYYTIYDSSGNQYALRNINELLGKYGVNGVKTGYTEEAGQVLVTSAVLKGHTFIIVVMKSENRFADTEKLLQMIEDNVSFLPIQPL